MRTVNGVRVAKARVYTEGGYWRWQITDERGIEFTDGGNFRSREQAEQSLEAALDPPSDEIAARLRKLILDGGYSQRGAARELQISERMMRYYCSGEQPVPRVVMLAMEHLVNCAHESSG